MARTILLVGLSLQCVTFAVFLVIAVHFFITARRVVGVYDLQKLYPLFTAVFISGVLIVLRSIYRAIEFGSMSFTAGETSGYLITNEWPFYAFDSVPIIIATYLINFYYPANYVPVRKGILMDRLPSETNMRTIERDAESQPLA